MGRPNARLGVGALVAVKAKSLKPEAWVRPLLGDSYDTAIVNDLEVIGLEETINLTGKRKAKNKMRSEHGIVFIPYVRMRWRSHPEIVSVYAVPGQIKVLQLGPPEHMFLFQHMVTGSGGSSRAPNIFHHLAVSTPSPQSRLHSICSSNG
ncbi:hypothetical protein PTSG_04742 [Salpingoeca rosetta]|uniref:Uncharacterized protein n=1 Tax=Salpingoeca rosetta (strain ATCC 50818 / BSB-021) TaxID=946362 RepID=F2U9K4_SALR5|nr:uncharacterized protein PTSG_04742 [Salpingoeca rosetta]EGD73031.1 hypothetical protein PTSG_04742 [Salpingoeca rosetta]|eukprot:XP_004994062.1 hypothetical protein PTSG_04742 [Salpingoeca rosetta]